MLEIFLYAKKQKYANSCRQAGSSPRNVAGPYAVRIGKSLIFKFCLVFLRKWNFLENRNSGRAEFRFPRFSIFEIWNVHL